MKVKALDESHLLVILTAQEADSLGLDAASLRVNSLTCRVTIARLFAAACERTEFPLCGSGPLADIFDKVEKVGIHAMSTIDGQWVFVFSAHPAVGSRVRTNTRKIYRVKTAGGPYCYRLASCGDLLNVLERLFRMGMTCMCQLVTWEQEYYLILSPKCRHFAAMHCLMREYGCLWGKGRGARAFLLEHGQLLASDAIARVGPCLI
ncbi:MAG: hypothetical protein HFJ84_04790 [Clostridiales bacterium]|nr:hypothetical protein [Clostridiales bacterium]